MYLIKKIVYWLANPLSLGLIGIGAGLTTALCHYVVLGLGLIALSLAWLWLWSLPALYKIIGSWLERRWKVGGLEGWKVGGLEERRVLLVTSAWHMTRAMATFHRHAPNLLCTPAPCNFAATRSMTTTRFRLGDFLPEPGALAYSSAMIKEAIWWIVAGRS